jgi:dolichol-phosphate mannosyltransferase
MSSQRLLSVVVPVCDEETNIQPFYQALQRVLDQIDQTDLQAEIIFVDDGSTDRSYEIICTLARKDNRVKCLRFSRNFGSHAAMLAGLKWTRGDAVVIISVDLQDPPELILEMVKSWRKGNHVVWAVREGRDDPFLKKVFALAFYKIFSRIALKNYPKTGMDFGLFDRCIIDNLNQLREVNHFVPGLILWQGYPQDYVYYHRRARLSGVSKWPVGKRIKNALDAICSFSYIPIRFISLTGICISLVSFIMGAVLIIRRLFFGLGSVGWPSIMVTLLFLGGVQLIMLGVLGEYVWRGTDQTRGRPRYIIMETTGYDNDDSGQNPADHGLLEGKQS